MSFRILGYVLLFIYGFVTSSGLDVMLPTLSGLNLLKPFLTWTPIFLIGFVFTQCINANNFLKIKEFVKLALIWIFFLVVHTAIMTTFSVYNIVSLGANIHFVVLLFSFILLFYQLEASRWMIRGLLAGLLLAIFLNFLERIMSFPFAILINRSSGFYLNPNGSAEGIVYLTLVMLLAPVSERMRAFLVGAGILAVAFTMSRSGMLLYFLLFILGSYKKLIPLKLTLKSLLITTIVFFFIVKNVPYVTYFEKYNFIQTKRLNQAGAEGSPVEKGELRLEQGHSKLPEESVFRSQEFLSSSFSSIVAERTTMDFSANQRMMVLYQGIIRIWNEGILFGKGLGYLYGNDQRTHNFFIESWLELGIFSLFFLPLFLLYLFFRRREDPAVVVLLSLLLLSCMFSHNIINSKPIIIAVGFLLSRFSTLNVKLCGIKWRKSIL